MRSTDAYAELRRLGLPLVETGEVAARVGISAARASQLLGSLAEAGLVLRVRPGLWALGPDPDPAVVAPYLTAPFPAYLSFWSALARHGMIEQIPAEISVASTGKSRRIQSALGGFSIHHLAPELFTGFTGSPERGYLATPEKALFDSVYLRAPRGGRLYLPELSLPEGFDSAALDSYLERIARPSLRTLVRRGLDQALAAVVEE